MRFKKYALWIMNWKYGYWICQIGGWGLLFLVSSFTNGLRHGYTAHLFLNQGLVVLAGMGITHLFRLYVHYAGWKELAPRQLIFRVPGSSLLLAIILHGVFCVLLVLGGYEPIGTSPEEFWEVSRQVGAVFGMTMILFLWSVIYFGLHYFRNYRQAEVDKWKLEARAETARLKALKLQLNPHFFFNSLNSVRALIAEDPERAQRMVTRLARLLRSTLQVDDVKTVPLKEELSTVRTYLELEQVRFEDRLQYRIDASTEALEQAVPFMLIQTLVENAIKHGIAQFRDGGTITIDATVKDDTLRLRVTNPGKLGSEDGGVGLENARERLQLLFGNEASLRLETVDENTVVATALLPVQDEEALASDSPPDGIPERREEALVP